MAEMIGLGIKETPPSILGNCSCVALTAYVLVGASQEGRKRYTPLGPRQLLLRRLKAPTVGALTAYMTHMEVGNAEQCQEHYLPV